MHLLGKILLLLTLLGSAFAPGLVMGAEATRMAVAGTAPAVAKVADLLQAILTENRDLILVERTEIQRVLREQTDVTASQNPLQLSRILGADGLLLLEPIEGGTASNTHDSALGDPSRPSAAAQAGAFNVRLIAVRPGVVLTAEKFVVEDDRLLEWGNHYCQRLLPLLSKLTVTAKEAIPISVVNIRSAVSTPEAPQLERQLQTLAIQRLSRELQLFVLERQKLSEAMQEKFLLADETAFWSGAWLLEGVVDRTSYSKHTLALNVTLTPAQSGSPIRFEVSGSRTNLSEVINALAAQVVAALKITSPASEWNAADEAVRFYAEAKWALDWGVHQQAQTAADAAWALGKRDLECALLRGKAYVAGVSAGLTPYRMKRTHFSAGVNADGDLISAPPGEAEIQRSINQTLAGHPWGAFHKRGPKNRHGGVWIDYAFATGAPSPRNIERAQRVLELYLEYNRTSPDGQPQVLTRGPGWNDWHNSDWYSLGLDGLVAVSRVLQNFYFAPPADAAVTAQLAELRALAREVATTISESPTVRDSFFVGERIATHDELTRTMTVSPNIFSCMTEWGCFWQERPEETLTLYRKLLASPVFCYFHKIFWDRGVLHPRLTAWNSADRPRLPRLWDNFLRELNDSTNVLWQMEAKALARADAPDAAAAEKAEQEWWSVVRSNRAALVANNVELFHLGWGFAANAETEAMNQEYWHQTIPTLKTTAVFLEQKKFLRENQPFELSRFMQVFRGTSYSQQQALELLPLVDAYHSNLLVKAQTAERLQKFRLEAGARTVDIHLRRPVEALARPQTKTPSHPPTRPRITPPRPAPPIKQPEAQPALMDTTTNIILVKKFLEIPLEELSKDSLTSGRITTHHLQADKLLLDLILERTIYFHDAEGKQRGMAYAVIPAIAVLDTKTEQWQVIEGEEIGNRLQQNSFYHHTTLWRGNVFTSQNGKVRQFDPTRRSWMDLELPDVGNCALFVVNDRLYGANQNLIAEIHPDGAGLRILASKRRQPPASRLDREALAIASTSRGTPFLFGAANGELRVITAGKVFSWDDTDWRELQVLPQAPGIPRRTADGILLIGDGWNNEANVWRMSADGNTVNYCLGPELNGNRPITSSRVTPQTKAQWKLPSELRSSVSTATSRGDDLLLLQDHAQVQNIVNEKEHVVIGRKILPRDGYHAELLSFSSNYALPQKLLLRFDDEDTDPPVLGETSNRPKAFGSFESWLCVANTNLYLGSEMFAGPPTLNFQTGQPPKIGVWAIPLASLDGEIARQKKIQDERRAQSDAARQKAAQKFLADFDRNRNGRLDDDEKGAALTEEAFIAAQLDQIDSNQNGWLDADELQYFDANQNHILETNEQIGIRHAQHLLAAQLLKRLDRNGDGFLDRSEFNSLQEAASDPVMRSFISWFPDKNGDQKLDVEELQVICELQTSRGISNRQPFGQHPPRQMPPRVIGRDANAQFKALVEAFWRSRGTNTLPSIGPNK